MSDYNECAKCDILISRTPSAVYDENYYYYNSSTLKRKWQWRRAEILWQYFSSYLKSGACLDFGCNDGSFVEVATRKGAHCEGTDINECALALARTSGWGIFRSPKDLVGRRFECVTAFDVIEHFDLVDEFFNCIDAYLEDNGLLIITTPNKNSKWRELYGEGWHGFGIPQYHRLILSERCLRHQLQSRGFIVEKVFTAAPIQARGWQLLIASGYRIKSGIASKIATLPVALAKLIFGMALVAGEEDTLCVVARKAWRVPA